MNNQLRFVRGNGCPLCAERAQLSAEIAKFRAEHEKFQRTEKERLDRLFQRIESCEAKARELGLYEAKKSE
jgi:chorismate mutase